MLFNLEVLSNEKKRIIRFDNVTNIFSDPETGENLLAASRMQDYLRLTDIYDFDRSDLGVLYINLGLNCNFKCKYCHQNKFRTTTDVVPCTPERALELIEILKKSDIHPAGVSFWGGEPLVFWKSIKVLVPALRELYPEATINFPTNGALLTEEIVDFLRKYNAGFYISYDGKATNRDCSIFDDLDIREFFQRTQVPLDIMPTQNRASIPIQAIRDELHGLGLKLRSISAYSIARCNPYNREQAEEIRIPQDRVDSYSAFIYRVLRDEEKHGKLFKGVKDRFAFVVSLFYRGLGVDSADVRYCGNMVGRDICIDCTGTIFNCMNIPLFKMGNILDFKPFDASKIYHSHLKKQACMSCPFVSVCRGGCPLIHDDASLEFEVNCNNIKGLAVPFFRMTVEVLLGVYLKRIVRVEDGKVFGEY